MQAVDRLLSFVERDFRHPEVPFPTGANAGAIKEFQRYAGVRLPDSLCALYARCDGELVAHGDDSPEMFYGLPFLSIEQATFKLHLFREGAKHDSGWTFQSRPSGGVREVYSSPKWIPFAGLYSTDYFALDYDPGPKGVAGQVILFSTDEARRTCVAQSFDQFLATMLTRYADRTYHPAFGWSLNDLYAIPFDSV